MTIVVTTHRLTRYYPFIFASTKRLCPLRCRVFTRWDVLPHEITFYISQWEPQNNILRPFHLVQENVFQTSSLSWMIWMRTKISQHPRRLNLISENDTRVCQIAQSPTRGVHSISALRSVSSDSMGWVPIEYYIIWISIRRFRVTRTS